MTTATTPSSFSAWLVSMRLIRACGCGECRILPTRMPGSDRSSVYLPAPVVLPAASTMAMGLPITENSVMGAHVVTVAMAADGSHLFQHFERCRVVFVDICTL